MAISVDEFRSHYQSLSDEALLEINPDELVAVARECYHDEISRRGLGADSHEAAETSDAAPATADPDAELEERRVCVVEFDYLDEAELAKGLLEAAEIPVFLEHEPGVVRLMVAEALADQALRMLASTPLSDEELAAQAEAAGLAEDEDGEDEEEPGEEPEEGTK